MDDASLDDFLGNDEGESADDGDDQGSPEDAERASDDGEMTEGATDSEQPVDTSESPRVAPDTVEPAAVTSRWDGGGVVCTSCGERTERGWESADGIVCPSCKEWS